MAMPSTEPPRHLWSMTISVEKAKMATTIRAGLQKQPRLQFPLLPNPFSWLPSSMAERHLRVKEYFLWLSSKNIYTRYKLGY